MLVQSTNIKGYPFNFSALRGENFDLPGHLMSIIIRIFSVLSLPQIAIWVGNLKKIRVFLVFFKISGR